MVSVWHPGLLGPISRVFRFVLCFALVLTFSSVATEKESLSPETANVSGPIPVKNGSAKVKNENPEKLHSHPPLVDMVHGKQMNSVAHDLLGSIEEMPPLVTEVVSSKSDSIPAHTEYNTLKSKLAEDNVTGVETLLEQALLVSQSTADNTTHSPKNIPSTENLPPLDVPVSVGIEVPPGLVKPPQEPPSVSVTQATFGVKKNESDVPHDDIPSFNEWANKKMAEVEKNKGENHTLGTNKIRLKNYASPDCGAKVVAANPEAVSPSAILSPSRDDYMLNPCNVKIWFAIELCESIQPQRIEIANFELFSSSPHNLSIWVSDRYPSREWSQVALIEAKDERTVQSFPLPRHTHFAKYVKVEMHSHYGSEHYCPVSLFKAYGTSELEVLDSADGSEPDDDVPPDGQKSAFEEEDESLSKVRDSLTGPSVKDNKKPGDDIFRTAKAAVLSIVQKAAQVLGNGGARNNSCLNVTTSSQCLTPGYQVVCNNCSDPFYYRLYEIMCCNGRKLKALLTHQFIHAVIHKSPLCSTIGIDFTPQNSTSNSSSSQLSIGMSYLRALLGDDTLAALCNYLAISRRKTALNVSQDKSKVEKVPPGELDPAEEAVPDIPITQPASQVLPDVDIEPTVTSEEPSASISPTKTLPVEKKLSEAAVVEDFREKEAVVDIVEGPNSSEEEPEFFNSTLPEEATQPIEPPQLPETDAPEGIPEPPLLPPPETVQQPTPSLDEPVLINDSLALETLFPDIEEEPQTQDSTTKATTVNPPVQQKESVFVRLANRIKALEVNMSLSSQYLEELSRRYKKQVEELQRALANMVEERRAASERETLQAAQLTLLTQKTEALTAAVTQLLEERNQWGPKAYMFGQHGVIVLIEVVVLFLVLGLCRRLGQAKTSDGHVRTQIPQRRHSVDGPTTNAQPKKRRPSEEALVPSSSTHKDLLIDGAKRKTSREGKHKRKRRRKDKLEDGLSVVSADSEEWIPTAPDFVRTAESIRRQRVNSIQTQTSSSQETLGSLAPPSANSSIKKKTGALKKIVKKLF